MSSVGFRTILLQLSLSLCGLQVSAQSFMLLRFDEDYSQLRDSSSKLYHKLKFLPLAGGKRAYLSFGGEFRQEFGGKIDEDWLQDQGYNYSILQRYSLHTAIHVSSRLKFFVQLNSAVEEGNKYGSGPTDEDRLNVQNLFGEYKFLKDTLHQLSFRLGRQEMDYGSGRLISVRDGNTTRQYFTGTKLCYSAPDFALDAFVMNADEVQSGLFDNRSSGAKLWGAYSNFKFHNAEHLDLYYLGIKRNQAQFEVGKGREVRHTLAARYWRKGKGFVYNLEAAYQFGTFSEKNISAWTTAIELGYTFEYLMFKPSVNLRNDYVSGDRKLADGTLQTFNPLYPKGGYFGFNPLIGPSNLIDIHPYLLLMITDRLSVQADLIFNWRYAIQDGLYRPGGTFNAAGSGSRHHYIGTTHLLSADYQFNRHIALSCGGQYFALGDFLKDITPHWANAKYFNAQFSFKF